MESVAVMVIGNFPVCVGVPDNVSPVNVIPAGSLPDCENVTKPMPPVCVKLWL